MLIMLTSGNPRPPVAIQSRLFIEIKKELARLEIISSVLLCYLSIL